MRERRINGTHAVLAAAIATLVVMPIAVAGAAGPEATKSASAKQKLKALSKRVAALEATQAPLIPTRLPPSGAAGGDLIGNFPNPELNQETVGLPEIVTNGVGEPELADNAVNTNAIQNGQLTASDLGNAIAVVSDGVAVPSGTTRSETVTCPGRTRLLGGGFEWGITNSNEVAIISSNATFAGDPNTTWEVQGRVNNGGVANTLFAEALCLLG